jgi:mannose-6-phosphate isomerase-like protein (cupin superfamily)
MANLILTKRECAPRYQRDSIESFLLVSDWTTGAKQLAVTLVEMQPGGVQHEHAHGPEQMYFLVEGSGLMTVDGESSQVGKGDCVFLPSGCRHGLKNTGEGVLKYLSAASPSFGCDESRRLWPLASLQPIRESDT